MLDLIENIQS